MTRAVEKGLKRQEGRGGIARWDFFLSVFRPSRERKKEGKGSMDPSRMPRRRTNDYAAGT